jgi:type I restriction enzyme S subunit
MTQHADWPVVQLEDVADDVTVGWVGPMTHEYRDSGVPFLRSMNVRPFRIDKNEIRYISSEFHAKIAKSRLTPGDVVIVRTGDPGTAAVIPDWLAEANCSDLVIVRPSEQLDPHYLAYFVNAAAHHQVAAEIVGAVQQHFNVGSAKRLRIPLPDTAEQQAIVGILRALDDKIELNRRMNATLEGMARGLFKSWFVDFDPVTAKAAGRQPFGLSADVAALFPDHFTDSPLGPIPEGWTTSSVGAEFKLTMGTSPPGSTYNEDGEGIPFFQGRRDFGVRYPTKRVYCTAPVRLAEEDDTLVSVRAPVGDVNMAAERCCVGRGLAAVRHHSGSRSYTYYAMSDLGEEFAAHEGAGTVFGSIGKTEFERIKQVRPRDVVIGKFHKVVDPLDQRIKDNAKNSRALEATRDALLPQLLSGEIRLRQAKKIVEEVA